MNADQQTDGESRIHQWRPVTINQEETGPSDSNTGTTSILDEKACYSKEMQEGWMIH